jgi:hypothetical protein
MKYFNTFYFLNKQEKEIQDQVLKENQLLVKEIAMKYAGDSESWNRQKQKLQEKEKLVKFDLFESSFLKISSRLKRKRN